MYTPAAFRVEDADTLARFIDRYGFATLASTCDGKIHCTKLPLLLDRERGVLLGHMARANPHWRRFVLASDHVAIFDGPHGYISPTWYEEQDVPTWNYATVLVGGTPRVFDDLPRLDVLMDRLVAHYEAHRDKPWGGSLPDGYRERMLGVIVGFEMSIARIEGTFKLNQNRSAADQRGVVDHLAREDAFEAGALEEFMRAQLNL